jgi:outer membrane lipopolysaccharide assembly protein LptE/RlpB
MRLFPRPYNAFSPILAVLLFLLFAAGCGYHFRPTGKPVGLQIESLAIPLMESTSSSLGFEGDFTRIIREEFASHAKFPLVSREKASTVLIGKVYDIKTDPYTYNLTETTVRGEKTYYSTTNARWLKIRLDVKLLDRNTGKVIWHDKKMEEKTTFAVGTDPLTNRYNEKRAVREIARTLAERIYLKTMERF